MTNIRTEIEEQYRTELRRLNEDEATGPYAETWETRRRVWTHELRELMADIDAYAGEDTAAEVRRYACALAQKAADESERPHHDPNVDAERKIRVTERMRIVAFLISIVGRIA